MKRITVDLLSSDRPSLIHKESERLAECVNILATVERLVAALSWFEAQPDMSANIVDVHAILPQVEAMARTIWSWLMVMVK